MATEAVLQARQDALDEMIATGVLSSSYQGSTITYRSMDELKAARAHVHRQLLKAQNKTPTKQYRPYMTKGL